MASFWDNFKKSLGDWKTWLIPGYAPVKYTQWMFDDINSAFKSQETANKTNVQLQQEANAQNQYNLEHAHQIEVADLQAAGLNPWLSVGGGAQGANIQAAQVENTDNSKMLQATTALMLLLAMKAIPAAGGAAATKKVFHYLAGKA